MKTERETKVNDKSVYEQEEFVMSRDLFDKDSVSERVRRKYMAKENQPMGFENTSGYHAKYHDSDPN